MAKKAVGRPNPIAIRAKRPLLIRLLEGNPLTRTLIYPHGEKNILGETRGNYPAPLAALEAVRYGLRTAMAAGYRTRPGSSARSRRPRYRRTLSRSST